MENDSKNNGQKNDEGAVAQGEDFKMSADEKEFLERLKHELGQDGPENLHYAILMLKMKPS